MKVGRLQAATRIEAKTGMVPFVETTTWSQIEDYITSRRESSRVNKFGVIVGPTGAQKSACLREFKARNNHGTTIHMEATEGGRIADFSRGLAKAYGLSTKSNNNLLRSRVVDVLSSGTSAARARRTIIIDNAQECWVTSSSSDQPIFTFLRRLQDETGCTIILSITPIFERRLLQGMIEGWFEQIEGRSGGRKRWLRLPEYAPDEDIIKIAEAFELKEAKAHIKALRDISREAGRIRRLFEDLQEGKVIAGKGEFKIEHIRAARGEV